MKNLNILILIDKNSASIIIILLLMAMLLNFHKIYYYKCLKNEVLTNYKIYNKL